MNTVLPPIEMGSLAPNVISLDAVRAWRELQMAVLAVKVLAEPKEEDE